MEESLIEVPTSAAHRCKAIELISDRTADETTILIFRHLREKHGLSEQIYLLRRRLRR